MATQAETTIQRLRDLQAMTDHKESEQLAEIMIDYIEAEGSSEIGFKTPAKESKAGEPAA